MDQRLTLLLGMVFTFFVLYVGFEASVTLVFVIAVCLIMLAFAVYLANWVLQKDEGTKDMQDVRICDEMWMDVVFGRYLLQFGKEQRDTLEFSTAQLQRWRWCCVE